MASFKAQVEGLTGLEFSSISTPNLDELNQFLTDGAKDVIRRVSLIKPQLAATFTSTSEDSSNSGVRVEGQIQSIVREHDSATILRPCTFISAQDRYDASDIDSLKYRSKYNPGYYILDGKIYSVPAAATSNNSLKVTQVSFPVVNYSSSTIESIPDEYEYLINLYASFKALFTRLHHTQKALPSDISDVVLSTTSTSLPTYTSPDSFVLPVQPPGVDVNFSDVGAIKEFVSPVFSIPTLGDMASMSLPSVPVPPSISSNSVSITGTAPTFVAPVMSAPDWSDTNNWISTEEDSEMSAARIQEIQGKVGEYSARLQEAQANFNKENAEYQAKLQKDLQDAQLEESKDSRELQKYQAELQSYQGEVNKEIQRWTSEVFTKTFNEWQQKYQGQLQQYGQDIQNESARISSSVQDFQAEVSKALQSYQAETGYDMSKYQSEIQANINKYQSDLSKQKTAFDSNLSNYMNEVQKVSSDNQNIIGKFNSELQNYAGKIQKLSKQYEWIQSRYVVLKNEYDEAFSLMMPPKQTSKGE